MRSEPLSLNAIAPAHGLSSGRYRARYIITYRGQPVGVLMPLEQATPETLADTDPAVAAAAWDELTRLGEEIGRGWRSPLSSTELLAETRR
jgi:hypothetical protein